VSPTEKVRRNVSHCRLPTLVELLGVSATKAMWHTPL